MMRVLLDTQVFVAAFLGNRLPTRVRALLANPGVVRLLSAASLLEIAIKNSLGKIAMGETAVIQAVRDLALTTVPLTARHAYEVLRLPAHHRDPFDRMLIATALMEDVPIVSADREFRRYRGLEVIWS